MRDVWIITILVLLTTALMACQASSVSTPVPKEPVAQIDTPGSLPESSATQAFPSTSPQEDTEMTPLTPQNETAEIMVSRAKGHLAQRLGLAIDQIVLLDIKPVVWRDAGLGCPKPGVDYIQVETPGYNILLEAGGNTYRYHTDETKRFVPCAK